MSTLESIWAKSRRYHAEPREVTLLCQRCNREFKTIAITEHCFPCQKAGRKAFGTQQIWGASGC